MIEVPPIRHARVFFELQPLGESRLPPYLGSTLRGGLMRAMRRIACVARGVRGCAECPFQHACTYALVFETPRPTWATRYPKMTPVHPAVIEPEPLDGGVSFGVRLFGRAVTTWFFVVEAARRMAQVGLGYRRDRFALRCARDGGPSGEVLLGPDDPAPRASVTVAEAGATPTEATPRATLTFRTPTRLVEGKVLLRRPTFQALLRAAAFRAASVAYFHAGLDWAPDRQALARAAAGVREVGSDIAWVRLNRFSTRQNQEVPLDGFTGWVTYEGPGLPALLPLLHLGEVLHVGKGTVFGLGKYEVSRDGEAAR